MGQNMLEELAAWYGGLAGQLNSYAPSIVVVVLTISKIQNDADIFFRLYHVVQSHDIRMFDGL